MSPHRFHVVVLLLAAFVVGLPATAAPPADVESAQDRLTELAEWFESLPPAERAQAARQIRTWAEKRFGPSPGFPFTLPSDEEIAAWEAEAEVAQETPTPSTDESPTAEETPTAQADAEETEVQDAEAQTMKATPTPRLRQPPAPEPTPEITETPAEPAAPRCTTLLPFDTDEDGTLTALDRFWRHLYLWTDADGNGRPSPGEMVSPYENDIREITLDLRGFVVGRDQKARRYPIEIDTYIFFDTDGDGVSAIRIPRGDDHALAVDADALRRDPRGVDLRDAEGEAVTGIQPIAAGWTITTADGRVVEVDCPK